MVRTQIQITEAQHEALRARAAEGRSMAVLIRESVDATSIGTSGIWASRSPERR